jgi:hypothetical protein
MDFSEHAAHAAACRTFDVIDCRGDYPAVPLQYLQLIVAQGIVCPL